MKEFFSVIRSSLLFSGISEQEFSSMQTCLKAENKNFPKGAFVLRAGGGAERERGGGERGDGDVSAHKARFERVPLRLLPP